METTDEIREWPWEWHEETPEWARHEFRRLHSELRRDHDGIKLSLAAITTALVELAAAIGHLLPGPPVLGRLVFHQGGSEVSDISIVDADTTPLDYSVEFDDAAGQVAAEAAPPVHSSSDESVGTVEASEDGLSGVFTPTGKEGATLVSVGAVNADGSPVLGSDGNPVVASGTVTVTAGPAATGSLTFTPQSA